MMEQLRRIRSHPIRLLTEGNTWVLLAIVLACLSAVAAALVSQHYFDMRPCPWCVLQRGVFLMIALVCGLALIGRSRILRLSLCTLALLLSVSGIAAALWQHVQAANSLSCGLSLAEQIISWSGLDRLAPDVMAPQTSCADGAVNLFGLPYEFWSLALFSLIAIVLVLMVVAAFRPSAVSAARGAVTARTGREEIPHRPAQ